MHIIIYETPKINNMQVCNFKDKNGITIKPSKLAQFSTYRKDQ